VSEAVPSRGPKRKGRMTPGGRKTLYSAALRKRWAAKRAAEGTTGATFSKKRRPTKKRAFSAATRKRLAEAMKEAVGGSNARVPQ